MARETGEASSPVYGNRRLEFNWLEKKDGFSDLPDPLIHHILSFLPSTKEAIRSGILSSRWRNLWTYVPSLIFDSTGMCCNDFLTSIHSVLLSYNCFKIRKFHLRFHYPFELLPQLVEIIRFAIERDVEELILNHNGSVRKYTLPEFIFNATSLVKLQTINCMFLDTEMVSWGFLKVLSLESCRLPCPMIAKVLSGSPVLESLELKNCESLSQLVIRSKSLEKLVLQNLYISVIEISCPKLEVLSLKKVLSNHMLFDQAIENVLIVSPKLESLELVDCAGLDHLIVVSDSLKRLVLGETKYIISVFEMACPNLRRLEFLGCLDFGTCKLNNLPSRICVALDFESGLEEYDESCSYETHESLAMDILQQLRHVQELKIGTRFMKTLEGLKVRNLSFPILNIKSLTLDDPNSNEHLPGIACALLISPVIETLVINVPVYRFLGLSLQVTDDFWELNDGGLNYWNSKEIVFNCLVSHLKTVKVMGLPERDDKCELLLNFVEFLLKNARVLEKMVIILEDYGTSFAVKVSRKLLSFSRCSAHVNVELLCSK